MKRTAKQALVPWALVALACLVLPNLALAQNVPPDWPAPEAIPADPIEFDAPEPTEATLSNGIRVFLMEDPSLPLIQGVAYFDAPALFEPDDKVGLAEMTAALLREGGAGGRSPEEIDLTLETLAASVEASTVGDLLAAVAFDTLSDNLDDVLPIWRDVLVSPDFDEQRLEVRRQRMLEAIRRVVDDPVQLAVREFFSRVREGHPTGRYPTEETVGAIAREDLIDFYESWYGPSVTTIAVTGDFDADDMIERLEETLGSWEHPVDAPPDIPPVNTSPEPVVYHAPKQIAQSVILVGHPAVLSYTPAYNDLAVANHILGAGGFTSRLFDEIRSRRGLAYATGSSLTEGIAYPGTFFAYAITRADATAQTLELMLDEIQRLVEEGVTEEEAQRARETLLNQSLFRFTSPSAVNERAARVALLDLEPGYYERYLENLQEITAEEVHEAARAELRPEGMVVLVVGNAEMFDRPLSEFGEVETIELE